MAHVFILLYQVTLTDFRQRDTNWRRELPGRVPTYVIGEQSFRFLLGLSFLAAHPVAPSTNVITVTQHSGVPVASADVIELQRQYQSLRATSALITPYLHLPSTLGDFYVLMDRYDIPVEGFGAKCNFVVRLTGGVQPVVIIDGTVRTVRTVRVVGVTATLSEVITTVSTAATVTTIDAGALIFIGAGLQPQFNQLSTERQYVTAGIGGVTVVPTPVSFYDTPRAVIHDPTKLTRQVDVTEVSDLYRQRTRQRILLSPLQSITSQFPDTHIAAAHYLATSDTPDLTLLWEYPTDVSTRGPVLTSPKLREWFTLLTTLS